MNARHSHRRRWRRRSWSLPINGVSFVRPELSVLKHLTCINDATGEKPNIDPLLRLRCLLGGANHRKRATQTDLADWPHEVSSIFLEGCHERPNHLWNDRRADKENCYMDGNASSQAGAPSRAARLKFPPSEVDLSLVPPVIGGISDVGVLTTLRWCR
jgi:hypothetical protein